MHVDVQVASPFTVHAVLSMYMVMFSTSHFKAVMSHNASGRRQGLSDLIYKSKDAKAMATSCDTLETSHRMKPSDI